MNHEICNPPELCHSVGTLILDEIITLSLVIWAGLENLWVGRGGPHPSSRKFRRSFYGSLFLSGSSMSIYCVLLLVFAYTQNLPSEVGNYLLVIDMVSLVTLAIVNIHLARFWIRTQLNQHSNHYKWIIRVITLLLIAGLVISTTLWHTVHGQVKRHFLSLLYVAIVLFASALVHTLVCLGLTLYTLYFRWKVDNIFDYGDKRLILSAFCTMMQCTWSILLILLVYNNNAAVSINSSPWAHLVCRILGSVGPALVLMWCFRSLGRFNSTNPNMVIQTDSNANIQVNQATQALYQDLMSSGQTSLYDYGAVVGDSQTRLLISPKEFG